MSAGAQPLDAAARLPVGGAAWEAYDLVAALGDGFRVTVRVMITNEGPGERNAVAFGHVVRPGAAPVAFQNGRREGAWRFAPDGRRIEIGSSLLVLGDGARHFEVDNDKRGVKVFLDWQADPNARAVPGVLKGYAVDLLQLATPVRASIQVGDMTAPRAVEGSLAMTHSRAAVAEADLLLRRIDVVGIDPGSAFYLLDLLGPEGARSASLATPTASGTPGFASSVAVGLEGPTVGSASYPLARRLTLTAPDRSGTVTLGESWLDADPLSALPTFLRMVYSLRGRPHRSWIDARFELSQAGSERPATRASGSAIAVLTFLDPLPSTPTHP